MARHWVGDFWVEVLHLRDQMLKRVEVAVYDFLRGSQYVEQEEVAFDVL